MLFLMLLVFSRIVEVVMATTGLRIPMLMSGVAGILVLAGVFSGRLLKLPIRSSLGMFLIFTAWMFVCLPASSWRGGSVEFLRSNWIPTLLIIAGVAGAMVTRRDYERVMVVIGLSALIIGGLSLKFGQVNASDSRMVIGLGGTLANGNELANLICLGLPFLLFPLSHQGSKGYLRVMMIPIVGVLILLALRTGSRAALLTILVIFTGVFLLANASKRLTMIIVVMPLALAVAILLPGEMLGRLKTLFTSDAEAPLEAVASTQGRTQKLMESIALTLSHPVLGVGPGVHQSAMVRDAQEAGMRADWMVSHNSITQVSSETGLVGLALYVMAAYVPAWRARRAYRRSRRFQQELAKDRTMVAIFALALLGLIVNGLFSSSAYLPFVCTMAILTDGISRLLTQSCQRLELMQASATAPLCAAGWAPAPSLTPFGAAVTAGRSSAMQQPPPPVLHTPGELRRNRRF